MVFEFARQLQQMPGFDGAYRPFKQGAVLVEEGNVAQPLRTCRGIHHHDIGQVAGADTAAHRELEPLQQAPSSPLVLQPICRDLRAVLVGRSAAAALADDHLTDHAAFGFQHGFAPRSRLFRL